MSGALRTVSQELGKVEPMRDIPNFFCWSKVGDEAGEPIARIVARKEEARRLDGGEFLWGIGQSVGQGVRILVDRVERPEVLFTNMASQAKEQDRNPGATALWTHALGLDGRRYEMPVHSLVTSRYDFDAPRPKRRHWALVCRTDDAIDLQRHMLSFRGVDVLNIERRTSVGGSQVTAAVEYAPSGLSGQTRYRVRFRVDLVAPYVLDLSQPVRVPVDLQARLKDGDLSVFEDLRRLAC